jgi:bacillopeptidase F
VVFTEAGSVRLLWEQTDATDLAGYRVYRRTLDTEFKVQGKTLLLDTEFVDSKVKPQTTYVYHVVAVDVTGNTSAPSQEIETRVP